MTSKELIKNILDNSKSLKLFNRISDWDINRNYKYCELFLTSKQFSFFKKLITNEKHKLGISGNMIYVRYNGVIIEFFKQYNGSYLMKFEIWNEKTNLFNIVNE